jgi:hypothetical protein
VQQSSAYYMLGATVADGTPCGPDTFDTCVNGQCIPAGCDHVLGSGKMLGDCSRFFASGTDVMIFKIFSPKYLAKKWRF